MDPNATLRSIRNMIDDYFSDPDGTNHVVVLFDLADHVEALDEWITAGGFLPDAWDGK